MLRAGGAQVVTAKSGAEAVAAALNPTETFDCVVLDVVMPDLSGKETATRIWAHQPDLPVVFVSGASSSEDANLGRLVRKPFRRHQLIDAVLAAAT